MKTLLASLILSIIGLTAAQFGSPLAQIGVDVERANIPVAEILSGGPPPQGIPALGFGGDWQGAASPTHAPSFVSQEEAATWLRDEEPVIVLNIGDEARAYPLQILTWHEIVNDTVAGVPVAVTFCPLCNSALAFDRRVPLSGEALERVQALNPDAETVALDEAFGEAYARQEGVASGLTGLPVTFGVSGLLINSNLLMFDTQTSTLWSQVLGEGNVGTLTDTTLLRYPAPVVSFSEFREAYPDAPVLSRETGFQRAYGQNPYVGYDDANTPPFLFNGLSDGRLPPKARVVTLELGEETVAYPFEILEEARVVNDTVAGTPLAVFWQKGTASALDRRSIAESRDVGATNVFHRVVDGRTLTFSWNGEAFVDSETGSTWTLLGEAVEGELARARLTPIVHDNTLWFAWAAFKPETRLYTGG